MALSRDQLQAAKLCIDCKQPSLTQRCKGCSRRVEEATNRFRGRKKFGAPTKTQYDLVDMKHMGEAWSKAYTLLLEIERASPMSPRLLAEKRSEPMHEIFRIHRSTIEILVREGGYQVRLVREGERVSKRKKPTEPVQLSLFGWAKAA